jgi:hypothetical protein
MIDVHLMTAVRRAFRQELRGLETPVESEEARILRLHAEDLQRPVLESTVREEQERRMLERPFHFEPVK